MLKILQATIIALALIGCFDKDAPKKDNNISEDINQTLVDVNYTVDYQKEYTPQQLELKSDFEKYLEYLRTLNTDGIVEMTYPKLFKPINKSIFIRFINTLLDSKEIVIESYNADIIDIGDIIDYGSGQFSNLEYIYTIKLGFINPNLYKDDTSMRILKNVLENKYGKDNIRVDRQNRTVMIKKREKLLAIKDKDSDSWKFLGDNSEYRKLYPEILPKEMLELI